MIDFNALRKPFPPRDVEWRLQECGKKGEKIWAMCLAYITNRAIMQRLDEVCSPENWKNQYQPGPHGGIICGLSIRCGDEWVTKWDGAENTQVEAVKGGLSDAMKRAAVQWGIGRYLYNLDAGFATITDSGEYRGKTKDNTYFKWNPPTLPTWALPEGAAQPEGTQGKATTPPASKSGTQGKLSATQAKLFPQVIAHLNALFGDDVSAKKKECHAISGMEDYRKLDDDALKNLEHKLRLTVETDKDMPL